MKKILIFSIAYYPLVGGAEVAIKEITDRIGDIYFDMITPRFDKKPASPSQGGSLKFEKIGNVNVYRICSPKLFFPFTALITAIQLHKKSKYDAIWAVMAAYAGFAASFFKLFHPKIPYLLTLQEGDPIEYIKKKVRFVYPLFKKIFTKADYIQCISNFLADWARQMGADCPIEVVPNGVDIKQFSIFNFQFSNNFQFSISKIKSDLGIREDEKILITTSRLVKKNAIEDVIEALQYLPENVKFLVLGIGPLEIDLKFKIKNLKLDGRVIFLGYVSHEDLPRYLKISDVFVRPSLSEGLGISFLEAMAAGIPVVATPVGGIPDFLVDGKTGWFCEVNNPQSVAEKINYILDEKNKEEVNRVAANAKKMVEEKYNWDNIALKMNNIFNALKIFSKYKKELNIDNGGRLKILIATGIFPPDIGGPAKYAKNLSEEFLKRGNEVNVLAYKTEKKLPIGIRHCLYFFRVVFNLHKTDLIIALDTFSVGLPAVIAAKIFNKKIIIRTGGDFFWESYVERSGNLITLKQFYEVKPALNL
ncbi:glycosyltransferase, partial [Patescibacteria group bacterium]|nr:glycosyltransferase [Patescibacteria group bacterium]